MIYVNFKNETYCIHWRYIKKNQAFEVLRYDEATNQDIIENVVPSDAYKKIKHFNKYKDGDCIVTECIIDKVNGVRDYALFASAEVRRSIADHHVKSVARTVTLRKALETFEDADLKIAIVNEVRLKCNTLR